MLIKQLQYIQKILEYGSITKAANALFISQPSLTKSLKQLEDHYKITIFERTPYGVSLTPEGRKFIYQSGNILETYNSLEDVFVNNKPHTEISHLNVASIQLDFVYEMMHQVLEENKDKRIHYILEETDRVSVSQKILSSECSLGLIVATPHDDPSAPWQLDTENLETTILDKSPVIICAGPKSKLYDKKSVLFSEVMEELNIVLDFGGTQGTQYYFSRDRSHFNSDRLIFVNSINACKHFILESGAILYINGWAKGLLNDERLRFIPVSDSITYYKSAAPVKLLLIKRKRYSLTDTETLFVNKLKEHFKKSYY